MLPDLLTEMHAERAAACTWGMPDMPHLEGGLLDIPPSETTSARLTPSPGMLTPRGEAQPTSHSARVAAPERLDGLDPVGPLLVDEVR